MEILPQKILKLKKLGLKNSQKTKICTQNSLKMEKLRKFQSSVFYEFGSTVQWEIKLRFPWRPPN